MGQCLFCHSKLKAITSVWHCRLRRHPSPAERIARWTNPGRYRHRFANHSSSCFISDLTHFTLSLLSTVLDLLDVMEERSSATLNCDDSALKAGVSGTPSSSESFNSSCMLHVGRPLRNGSLQLVAGLSPHFNEAHDYHCMEMTVSTPVSLPVLQRPAHPAYTHH